MHVVKNLLKIWVYSCRPWAGPVGWREGTDPGTDARSCIS